MNLAIDIGNTHIKAALFNGGIPLEIRIYNSLNTLIADYLFIKQAKQAIIGSVVNKLDAEIGALKQILPIYIFTSTSKIPIKNLYQTISTLGSDRIAAAIGAQRQYPNSNLLVIDAGTCIKYNFVNANNEYLGGGISPGIQMRFKALHQFTSRLPLIEKNESFDDLIGKTTENSILSGVLNGCVHEIDGTINAYKNEFPNLICVLSGGDSEYLAKRLKNSIFTNQNLVLTGLNEILHYNLENK